MKLGSPRVSLEALKRVGEIVAQMGFDRSTSAVNPRPKENIYAKNALLEQSNQFDATDAIPPSSTDRNRRSTNPSEGNRNIVAATVTGRSHGRQISKAGAK